MSPTITNEAVQIEYQASLFITNAALMVEIKEETGSIQVNMNAQMQEMRGGMNG